MGNFLTSEPDMTIRYDDQLKSNTRNTQCFTIERILNNQIRIGIHKHTDGIKYFPNPENDECYHSNLKTSNITDDNKATFYYDDGSVLDVSKINGKETFTYTKYDIENSHCRDVIIQG